MIDERDRILWTSNNAERWPIADEENLDPIARGNQSRLAGVRGIQGGLPCIDWGNKNRCLPVRFAVRGLP